MPLQFPGLGSHLLSGHSLKARFKVIVNWSNRLPLGLAYVMLSRAERLENVYIAGRFDPRKSNVFQKQY